MNVTKWGDAVLALLEAGKIRQADLARDVSLSRVVLNRYLKGEREAPDDAVLEVNEKLQERLSYPGIQSYLNALHWAESADDVDLPDEIHGDGVDMIRAAFGSYLRPEAEAAVELGERLSGLGPTELRKLLLALCVLNRKRFVSHIRGFEPSGKSWFEELRGVCERHGVSLKALLRTKRELREPRATDDFVRAVDKALVSLSVDPSARLRAQQEILLAGFTYATILRNIERNEP